MASDDTRARIIETAGPLFAEKGFRDTTIREICDAAGVGLASVNYHFRDKQQLYVHVVEAAFDFLDQRRSPLRPWPPGTPVEVCLREWIERLVQKIVRAPKDAWQDRLLTREMTAQTPECRDVVQKRVDQETAPIQGVLEEILPGDANASVRNVFLLSIVGHIVLYDTHRDIVQMLRASECESDVFDPAKVTAHVTHIALSTLGLAPPFGRPTTQEEHV